jgi:hypothetical protein
MTSLNAMTAHPQPMSPRERLQKELESEVASGSVSTSDASALATALDAIDETMKADATGASSGTRPNPGDMEKKISALIDQQVEDGTLTSDQADELKTLFQKSAESGGPRGASGPPPPPPSGGEETSGETDATSLTADDLTQLLQAFLAHVKQATGSTTGYATDGTAATSTPTALVLDQTA